MHGKRGRGRGLGGRDRSGETGSHRCRITVGIVIEKAYIKFMLKVLTHYLVQSIIASLILGYFCVLFILYLKT